MPTTQIGTAGLIQLPSARVYDPASGDRNVARWKGDHADVLASYNTYVGSGVRASVEPGDGGKAVLVVEDMGAIGGDPDDAVEIIWTLAPMRDEASLWDHPSVVALTSAMTNDGLRTFRGDMEKLLNPTYEGEVIDISLLASPLDTFARMLMAGQNTYTRAGAVLRKTRIVSRDTNLSRDLQNVERVYTTAQLVSWEDVPDAIISTLEVGGWLKTFGGVEQLSDGRFQLTVEWDYAPTGVWPTPFPYAVAS